MLYLCNFKLRNYLHINYTQLAYLQLWEQKCVRPGDKYHMKQMD